uniref:Transmembrane protein 14C n=1 Tax=Equus caballus TaxID=9796 RepID=A0A9L0SDW9_HORSE
FYTGFDFLELYKRLCSRLLSVPRIGAGAVGCVGVALLVVHFLFSLKYDLNPAGTLSAWGKCLPRVPLHWIGFGYAALIASGGIIGYAKAGSVPSLAAGLLFGGLAGLGAYQLSQDPRNIWVFLATSGTLAGIMGMRFYHSGKFMPAGLIAGASLLMVAKLGISVFSRPHQS